MPRPHSNLPWLLNSIKTHNSDDCLRWPFSGRGGYGRLQFRGKTVEAHRLAFYLTHGRWPTPNARHTCDNPPCVNPRHIIEGTMAENMADKVARNRQSHLQGTKHPLAKLTDDLVRQIRREYIPGNGKLLAAKYGIHQSKVSDVITRKTWRHVT